MLQSLFDRFMRLYMSRVAVKKVFDKIQRELHCCGNKRYDDWFDVGGPLFFFDQKFSFSDLRNCLSIIFQTSSHISLIV